MEELEARAEREALRYFSQIISFFAFANLEELVVTVSFCNLSIYFLRANRAKRIKKTRTHEKPLIFFYEKNTVSERKMKIE